MGYTYMDSTPQILSGMHIQVDMTNRKAIKSYATIGFKYHIYIHMDLTITQSGLPKIKAPLHPIVHRRSALKLQVFEAIYATCSN